MSFNHGNATGRQPSSFPFLSLPREIRDKIYKESLLTPRSLPSATLDLRVHQLQYDLPVRPNQVVVAENCGLEIWTAPAKDFDFLLACRQIRDEYEKAWQLYAKSEPIHSIFRAERPLLRGYSTNPLFRFGKGARAALPRIRLSKVLTVTYDMQLDGEPESLMENSAQSDIRTPLTPLNLGDNAGFNLRHEMCLCIGCRNVFPPLDKFTVNFNFPESYLPLQDAAARNEAPGFDTLLGEMFERKGSDYWFQQWEHAHSHRPDTPWDRDVCIRIAVGGILYETRLWLDDNGCKHFEQSTGPASGEMYQWRQGRRTKLEREGESEDR